MSHIHCTELSSYTLLGISISFFRVHCLEINFTRNVLHRLSIIIFLFLIIIIIICQYYLHILRYTNSAATPVLLAPRLSILCCALSCERHQQWVEPHLEMHQGQMELQSTNLADPHVKQKACLNCSNSVLFKGCKLCTNFLPLGWQEKERT